MNAERITDAELLRRILIIDALSKTMGMSSAGLSQKIGRPVGEVRAALGRMRKAGLACEPERGLWRVSRSVVRRIDAGRESIAAALAAADAEGA